jgi:hypothetical protein
MIAAHLDNLLFLLLVVVAVLFQFLAKIAAKTGKDQTRRTSTPPLPGSIPRAPTESDEDRIRKLLEALGQPPTSKPPPLVVPRTGIPPRPLAPVQPPLSPVSQLKRLRKREVIPPTRTFSGAKEVAPPKITSVPSFEVHKAPEVYTAATPTIAKAEEARIDLATLLASKSGLRDAVVLREILGPPRGLRALKFIGT